MKNYTNYTKTRRTCSVFTHIPLFMRKKIIHSHKNFLFSAKQYFMGNNRTRPKAYSRGNLSIVVLCIHLVNLGFTLDFFLICKPSLEFILDILVKIHSLVIP
jgi:hypothetical protein